MKRYPAHLSLFYALTLAATIFIHPCTARATPGVYNWGISIESFKKQLPAGDRFEEFSPGEKKTYVNKIISYMKAIDEKIDERLKIIRTGKNPEIDYVFVKNTLYTTLENWGMISAETLKAIIDSLNAVYGMPDIQKDKSLTIYSYKNDQTKVLLYIKAGPDRSFKCRIYYYSNRLFRMLILE